MRTQGSHAIVAIDLSTQIHGELHTSQLGTFSGDLSVEFCQDKKRLPPINYTVRAD